MGMLVLSRGKDQSVMVGDEVKVTVVDIKGDKVRLGFEAPRGVAIHREEIYLRIKEGVPRHELEKPDGQASEKADSTS